MCSSPSPTPQYIFPDLSLLFHFFKRISSWICGFIKNIFIAFVVDPAVQGIPHPLPQVAHPRFCTLLDLQETDLCDPSLPFSFQLISANGDLWQEIRGGG